ncbi:sulfurtransferase [Hydrogenophaga sp.]|uniref:sulfurtransferase n=1 Tax=Hydrogenophaga sp. TaxID=1904254 RepID=UPI0027175AD3|nr:sulfurtransferase [Hydrogenophaga sp.]MDO8904876.1 sulfurtransferase [Hydrogenophaga sp.]
MHTTLITAEALQVLLNSRQPPLIFDCSFDLTDPAAGRALFEDKHLPGARHADLNLDLSAHNAEPGEGRHPLPSRKQFADWLGAAGLTTEHQVVVYDRLGAHFCGRLWWMLKWVGHEAVAVLDGGLPAWLAEGGSTEKGPSVESIKETDYPLRDPLVNSIGTATLTQRIGDPKLTIIDARAAARFRGDVEPLDPVAGHIPGALNRPFSDNLMPDGRFKPAETLRAEFNALLAGRDAQGVVHQCGSGVSAIPNLLAMELAGLGRTTLYPGSWSAWCNTPGTSRARS